MTPNRFRECLTSLAWSQRGLAGILAMDERQVRRWASGATIPEPVAVWLDKLARYHEKNLSPQKGVTNAE